MAQSLLESLTGLVTPEVLQSMSKLTGEPQAALAKGMGAAFPALLSSLLQGSGNAGLMQQIAGLIGAGASQSSWLGSIGSLLASGKFPGSAWGLGSQLLSSLYANKLDGVTGAIASFAGLRPSGAASVLGFAAPMLLGQLGSRLGQSGGVNAAGLTSLLGAEKASITSAMPAGLATLITQLSTPSKAAAAIAAAGTAAVGAAAAAAAKPATAQPAPAPAAKPAAAPAPAPAAAAAKPAVAAAPAAAAKPAVAAAPVAAAAKPAVHHHAADAAHSGGSRSGFLAIWWPLLLALAGLIWWWASSWTQQPATKVATAPAPAAKVEPAKPATPPAAAPAPKAEAPKAEAPKVEAPKVEPPKPVAAAPTPPPAPAAAPTPPPAPAAAPAPAPAPAAAPTASAAGKRALSTGAQLEFAADGIESKVIAFIEDAGRAVDKTTWFDFDRLNFKTGSAELTPESMQQVKNMFEILRAFPAVKLKIGGYTDNTGDAEKNLKLSQARADAVVNELQMLGVGTGRLEAEGYGEQHPIASNDTAEGRAKNRRISVRVTAK